MDRILEISNLGLRSYGRIFDFYLEQRQIEDNAARKKIVENLNLKYQNFETYLWKKNLNFEIIGNKYVSIFGQNDSDKTTLIQLITCELKTSIGEIKISSKKIAILNKACSLLEEDQTMLENMQKFEKSKIKTHKLRICAERFFFIVFMFLKKLNI